MIQKKISYHDAMTIIWQSNDTQKLQGAYHAMNDQCQNIIYNNTMTTPEKEKRITDIVINFTHNYGFYDSFIRRCGFYKQGMEKYLTITP